MCNFCALKQGNLFTEEWDFTTTLVVNHRGHSFNLEYKLFNNNRLLYKPRLFSMSQIFVYVSDFLLFASGPNQILFQK